MLRVNRFIKRRDDALAHALPLVLGFGVYELPLIAGENDACFRACVFVLGQATRLVRLELEVRVVEFAFRAR